MSYWNDPEYQRRRRAKGKPGEASMSISRRSWHDPGGPDAGYLQDRTAPAGVRRGISITAADFDRAFNPEERAAVTSTFGRGALEKLEHPVQPFFGERNLAQERRGDLVQRYGAVLPELSREDRMARGLPGESASPVDSGVRDVGSQLQGLYTREDGTVGLKEPDETYRSATVMALNEDIARAFGMGGMAVHVRRGIFQKMIQEDIERRMAERQMGLQEREMGLREQSLQAMMSNPDLSRGQVGKTGMSFGRVAPKTPLAEKRAAYKLRLIGELVGRQDTGEDDAAYAKRVKAAMAIAGEMAAADLPDEGGRQVGAAGGEEEAVYVPWSEVDAAQRARIYQKTGIRTEEEYNLAAEQMGYR